MKFKQLAAASMLVSTFALAACGAEPETVVESEPEGVPGLSVENARLVLAPVSGNPAAGYFDLKYENDRGLAIRRADVGGSEKTEIHAYGEWNGQVTMAEAMEIAIKNGTEIAFEPGGYHLMVF
ncbi:MAG: copper chaperone PCu(A)C, partial [Altererythrobacter sp.]|nr:copper chaperone PCu(A)C [Altererythrobacter sp.]